MTQGIGFTNEIFTHLRPDTLGTVFAWYRADAESYADGDAVGTFNNQLGAFPDLTQGTAANKPLFKLNAANGRAALLFDGTNDHLVTTSFAAEAQPITVYIVAKRVGSEAAAQQLADGIGSGNRMTLESLITTGLPSIFAGTTLSGFDDLGSGWFVMRAVFNGGSSSIAVNDIFHATGAGGAHTLTGITLGASYAGSSNWNGYIAEVLYFDGTLSTDNDYTIRRYLMAKYKIDYFDPSSIATLRSKFLGDSLRYRDSEGIALWEDPISGYNLIQATAANQPLAIRDELNHRTVARFDGTNDFLRSVAFSALSQPRTIITVAKNTSHATAKCLFDGIASGNRHAITYQTSGNLLISAGSSVNSGVDAGLGWNIISTIFNGGSSLIRRNGTQENTGGAGAQTLTGYTLGVEYNDASPAPADVYALLVYDGALSTLNMQRVEGWLKGLTAL